MGCCLSVITSDETPRSDPHVLPPNRRQHLPGSDTSCRSPPPPPPVEEETVKEVLSETPIAKPLVAVAEDHDDERNQKQPEVEEVKIEPTAVIKPAEEIIVSEVSEVSEMCSFSESLSTVAEKREDDGDVTQRVQRSPVRVARKRPCPGELARGKERGVRSPATRSAPSPVKRTHVGSRSAQSLTMSTAAASRRNIGTSSSVVRRDAGEGSGRRSRSPAMRGEAGPRRPVRQKSPASTRNGRSGNLASTATVENGGEQAKPKDEVSPETAESIENPLVSLECFIFV